MKTAFQVKMELLDPWVQEALLEREDGQGFLEPQGLEVMMVLEEVMDNRARLVPLELQGSLVPLVLRVKLDLQDLLVQVVPLDKEENLDLRDMLVLKVLLVLLGLVVVLAVKVIWVPLAFLELLGCQEPVVLQDQLVPMVLLDSAVLQVNPVRMVPKESQDHVVNAVKRVLQVIQVLRVKMAKMVRLENLVQMELQELQEKGVNLEAEDLLELVAFREKRVPLGSAVVQALQGPEDLLEKLAEMAFLAVPE